MIVSEELKAGSNTEMTNVWQCFPDIMHFLQAWHIGLIWHADHDDDMLYLPFLPARYPAMMSPYLSSKAKKNNYLHSTTV